MQVPSQTVSRAVYAHHVTNKTSVHRRCAHVTRSPLVRLNLTPHTTIADLLGQIELDDGAFGFRLGRTHRT